MAAEVESWGEARRRFAVFRKDLEEHIRLEEELMFPSLEAATGVSLEPGMWRRGYRLALRDFIMSRLSLFLVAHAERSYPFLHRVVPNFVVQDGCPRGDGWGGPGYEIPCEYNDHAYVTGTVGMALSGKDTGGSQWFVTLSPQPRLEGRYTVFAAVTRGMEVVERIMPGDRILSVTLK